MKRTIILIFALAVLMLGAFVVTAHHPGHTYLVDSCDGDAHNPGRYFLTQDVEWVQHPFYPFCLHIAADDVVLDCQGHTIRAVNPGIDTGLQPSLGTAITVRTDAVSESGSTQIERRQNVQIMNCNIEDFNTGIVFDYVSGGVLLKNTITDTVSGQNSNGIVITNSDRLGIKDNVVQRTPQVFAIPAFETGTGISISQTDTSLFMGNTIIDYAQAISVSGERSTGNAFSSNVLQSNYVGIDFSSVANNLVYRNEVTGNNIGIRLASSNANQIFNNAFGSTEQNARETGVTTGNIWNSEPREAGVQGNVIGGEIEAGNYWHDYYGEDLDGDGIGDTNLPYNSNGGIVVGGDGAPLISSCADTSSIPLASSLKGDCASYEDETSGHDISVQ